MIRSVGIAMSALLLLFCSCTEVNDSLGSNLVPPGQQMEVDFASFTEGFATYLTLSDSVATSSLDYGYIGKMTNEGYGTTRAATLVEYAYAMHTDTVTYEDRTSVPDSLVIICNMKAVAGDTLKEQTFDIYRLKERIQRDSTYYNSIDYREMLAAEEPLFTFRYSGKPTTEEGAYDTLYLKMANEARAKEFMQELWDADEALYENDSLFMEQFKGLCIAPAESSPEDASIYGINLQFDSTEGPETYLILFGHSYLTASGDPNEVEEDIMRAYMITNSRSYSHQNAISAIEHDYSATPYADKINLDVQPSEPLQNPTTECKVQSLMGVATTVELSEELIAQIKALEEDGKELFINQAMLQIELSDNDYLLYDSAPNRLGAYLDYPKAEPIADYNYFYEANYDTKLNYGGYLNRSHNCYSMDISLYLQQLVEGVENIEPRITLGITAYDIMKYSQVSLNGASISLQLTYTLLGQ